MVPFLDRQRLKTTEDKILDLKIIFDCLSHTVSHLSRQCQSNCLGMQCIDCRCPEMIEELEEQLHDIEINIKRTEVLHKRAQATAQLVYYQATGPGLEYLLLTYGVAQISDVLAYENAQVMNLNGRSLYELTQESKEENSKMRILTVRQYPKLIAENFSLIAGKKYEGCSGRQNTHRHNAYISTRHSCSCERFLNVKLQSILC